MVNKKIEYYNLTHPQKRVWYLENVYPGTSMFNIGGPVIIHGEVNFNILKLAINKFLSRNDGTRLRILLKGIDVQQYIKPFEEIDPLIIDFSVHEYPRKAFKEWVEEQAKKPFELIDNNLFEFTLFKISEKEYGYLPKFHHIIADGWSMKLLTEKVSKYYEELLVGEMDSFEENCTYLDYIYKESTYLKSERFIKNKRFWNKLYMNLPKEFRGISSKSVKGNRKSYQLSSTMSNNIRNFVAKNKVSLNTFFIFAYLLYSYKKTGQTDVILGTPVLNRSGKKEKSTIGMFSNAMPCRFLINEDNIISDAIIKVKEDLAKFYFHQKYPYEYLTQDLELKKKGIDNLYNICVNYYNTKLVTKLNGMLIENTEFYNGQQLYSLQLVVKDWSENGELTLEFDYKLDDYSEYDIEQMYKSLLVLFEKIITNETKRITEISLLTLKEENEIVYHFNNTARKYSANNTVIDLFNAQVAKKPNRIAARHGTQTITYKELNDKSDFLACYLTNNKSVKVGDIVGVCMRHSIETIVTLLGVLKTGAAYLPIDPNLPENTLNQILEDSKCNLILTNSLSIKLNHLNCDILNVNRIKWDYHISHVSYYNQSKPHNLAYIIYTSGSTGKPKGVMIEHKSLVNYVEWANLTYLSSKLEVFAFYSSLSFDLTVTSIFTPIISGNIIEIYDQDEQRNEFVLYRIINEGKATIVKLTPSHLSLLRDKKFEDSSIKTFIVGGENLTTDLAKTIYLNFNQKIQLFNEYGPTEATVGCMVHKYEFNKDTGFSVPLGTPVMNTQVYILDKDLQPVPPGIVGELYISGEGLSRGYLKKPQLTCKKFINHPFFEGKRLYATNDLAKINEQNTIIYVGRTDKQVKINGYRIELGEIEYYLEKHFRIKQALVISRLDVGTERPYLCAYIVLKDNSMKINYHDIREFLSHNLPDYKIPAKIVELNTIPLTFNGKVDYELLPTPEMHVNERKNKLRELTHKETVLIDVLKKILNKQSINIQDDFFQLGADSIHAILLCSRLGELGYNINVQNILNNRSIEKIAECMTTQNKIMADQGIVEGYVKNTPIVSWFFEQKFGNMNHYNQSIVLDLKKDISVWQLEKIMANLIRHHDTLRMNYDCKTNALYYNPEHLKSKVNINTFDLSNLASDLQNEHYAKLSYQLKSSFDISKDLLIKAGYFIFGEQRRTLLITAHHLIIDAVSWRIVIQDLELLLRQLLNNQPLQLTNKTHSYQKWAETVNNYAMKIPNHHALFWNNIQKKSNTVIKNTLEYSRNEADRLTLVIDLEKTQMLLTVANKSYSTHADELLIIALAKTLKEVQQLSNVWIEVENHGRGYFPDSLDFTKTIGWFTALYPLMLILPKQGLEKLIIDLKEQIREFSSKGFEYGVIRYLLKENIIKDKPYIRFNYMGDLNAGLENEYFKTVIDIWDDDQSAVNSAIHVPSIDCYIYQEQLHITMRSRNDSFIGGKIEDFIQLYKNNIINIIDYCSSKKIRKFTPSDFETANLSQEDLDSLWV